jgi:hypothetical protein
MRWLLFTRKTRRDDVGLMQSAEGPLIRPPATFSPYEGEKGRGEGALSSCELF